MEGARLECLGVLEAAGQVCMDLVMTLTVAIILAYGHLVVATPARTLAHLYWDLGMSAGLTTCDTVSSFLHFINASPSSLD